MEVEESKKYTMTISRLIIDKLGIKLYDRVAAVLAELIANAYDADAENVTVEAPLGIYLAKKSGGDICDLGLEMRVTDDGVGMTTEDVNRFYLKVGLDRRVDRSQETPKGRKVMGRKGIGKLAPFGICKEIEVISAGGTLTDKGYPVANLLLRFDDILSDTGEDYYPQPGPLDGTFRPTAGTTIVLRDFAYRLVPNTESLHRQLASRFGITRSDWKVEVADSRDPEGGFTLGSLAIPTLEGTHIDLAGHSVPVPDVGNLPISGWVGYSRGPYKDESMAGVRIFARGKYVAQTRDFAIRSGFTGEFKMRSYLVGEVHADWLDEDEDLIRSDRQDIIWNSDLGLALQEWGQSLIKELARRGEASIGAKVWEDFLERSGLEEQLSTASPRDERFRSAVRNAARVLLRRADRDAVLQDPQYRDRIVQLAFSIGPHEALLEALDQVASSTEGNLGMVLDLFEKARVVELYSLGQVADERVRSVQQLTRLISSTETTEPQLQSLIEAAPWIINSEWTPLTMNQSLANVRLAFESWYALTFGSEISTTTIENPTKIPDFVMLGARGALEIIEIKRPGHALTDVEYDRAFGYLQAVQRFINENAHAREGFTRASLTLVCDQVSFTNPVYESQLSQADNIQRRTWHDVLSGTMRAHQDFIERVKAERGQVPAQDVTKDDN